MRCFIANKELKVTRGAIEITYARPAKENKPKAQVDFRRLLQHRLTDARKSSSFLKAGMKFSRD